MNSVALDRATSRAARRATRSGDEVVGDRGPTSSPLTATSAAPSWIGGRSREPASPITKRSIVIAVLVFLAVMAARATAAPAARLSQPARASQNLPVVVPPIAGDDCEGDSCDTGDTDATNDSDEPATDIGQRRQRRRDPCGACGAAAVPCSPCAQPIAVSAVAAAGVRAAGLADDPTPSWRYRTRLAGLVPQLSVRAGRNLTWKDVDDPTLGYTNMWDVRVSWHLERLMFDPNEIRIEALDVSRRRERRRVEMTVIHTYYQWLVAASERPELTADLDAMTAGWFSEELAKGQKP